VEAFISDLLVPFSAGTALMLIGVLHLLAHRKSWRWKVGSTAVIILGACAALLGFGDFALTVTTAGLTVLVGGILVLVTSGRAAAVLQAMPRLVRRPATRGTLLAVVGGALVAGAYAKFVQEEQAAIDRDNHFVEMIVSQPETRLPSDVQATTDHGRRVQLREVNEDRSVEFRASTEHRVLSEFGCYGRVIRITPADDSSNCHGWVFTGGRFWVSHVDVENILVDNGYVSVTDPQPGDLAIYRHGNEISHTGLVRAIVNGMPPLVEGKWGWMGVFLHPVGDSIYGSKYTFYRSQRDGHLLAGLESPPNSKEAAEKLAGAQ
jgi:hypothetical protein